MTTNELIQKIEELIQQGETFTNHIKAGYKDTVLGRVSLWVISDEQGYENWKAVVKQFLRVYSPNNESTIEFEKLALGRINPDDHKKMIALLNAVKLFPQPARAPKNGNEKSRDIHFNISQNTNQTNTLTVYIDIKTVLKESGLNDEQIKEIEEIKERHKSDLTKAKPEISKKLMSFGENVLSNILANIITNPNLLGCL